MTPVIDIGIEFYHRLVNRNKLQGDGTHTGVEFREKFLGDLDNEEWWKNDGAQIILDFGNVKTLGPSWANEVFAYFTAFAKPEVILEKIQFVKITEVKLRIIKSELDAGWTTK